MARSALNQRIGKIIGLSIRHIREQRGLSQQKLAVLLGCDQGHISRIERGIETITVETGYKIAYALNVELGDLFLENNEIIYEKRTVDQLSCTNRDEDENSLVELIRITLLEEKKLLIQKRRFHFN